MKSTGRTDFPQERERPLHPLAQIADRINDADLAIEALLDLLAKAEEPVTPRSIARLLKPHHEALRRAAEDLDDHF